MDYSKFIAEGETVECTYQKSKGSWIKNSILANIFYVILWLGFDAFFVYVITMDGVKEQFWLTLITVAGLNLLRVWTYGLKFFKETAEMEKTAYVMTDKAIYYICDGKFKTTTRIAYEDIIAVEKSEYYYDGFYVGSANQTIRVIDIANETELFGKLAGKIKG